MTQEKKSKNPMDKIIDLEQKLRHEFCVEVTNPLTVGEAREIAVQLYNGGVAAAIHENGNGTYTVWRKPFSDEWLELPPSTGGVECCIMKRKHPKRDEFMEVLEP